MLKKKVINLEFQVKPGVYDTLKFNEGDNLTKVAREFTKKHKMNEQSYQAIL